MLLRDAKQLTHHAIATNRLGHAFMLVGSPHGAAAQMALFMMQTLVCDDANSPCEKCEKCRQIAARTWCDALWVYPTKKSRVISVDQMRRGHGDNKIPPPYLLPWIAGTSFGGGWKCAVISDADRMNETAANAFLKTLEEPPPKTLILLLTDAPQLVIPTIRSRCQRLDIDEPPREAAEPWRSNLISALTEITYDGPIAATAMATKVQAVLKGMLEESVKDAAKDPDDDDATDADAEDKDARLSAMNRENRELLVTMLQRWFRDMLIIRSGGSAIHYTGQIDILRERAKKVTLAQALANVEILDGLARQLERSLPESSLFAYCFDRLATGV